MPYYYIWISACISNFAFQIPSFRQFSIDFDSFPISGNLETWKPGNYLRHGVWTIQAVIKTTDYTKSCLFRKSTLFLDLQKCWNHAKWLNVHESEDISHRCYYKYPSSPSMRPERYVLVVLGDKGSGWLVEVGTQETWLSTAALATAMCQHQELLHNWSENF